MPQPHRNHNQRSRGRHHQKSPNTGSQAQIGNYIPSPYNFVPLSTEVFFSDGDKIKLVSIDKPFSDGISGTLRIKITAKTPIYIRNGGIHPSDQQSKLNNLGYQDFFHIVPHDTNSPYAIPGTSFKGMLRNVVEIASFGKISDKVFDERCAFRNPKTRKKEQSKHSIHQRICHTSSKHAENEKLDLGESIFGRVNGNKGLRGRVSVESLIAEGKPQKMDVVETVLNGPKPSYYPNYVKQPSAERGMLPNGTNYKTYMDDDAEIRGWKRYIVRPDSAEMPQYDDPPKKKDHSPNLDVATRFRPLAAGTAFTGTLHIHNLRPFELGALVWAITWGGNSDLRHNLGMGKPYGFGSVALEITQEDLKWCDPGKTQDVGLEECQKAYTNRMEQAIPGWAASDQLTALQACANPATEWLQELRYPKLGQGRGYNEFEEHKKANHALVAPPGVRFVEGKSSLTREAGHPIPVMDEKELLLADIKKAGPQSMQDCTRRTLALKDPDAQRKCARAILERCKEKSFKNSRKKAESKPDHWINQLKQLLI